MDDDRARLEAELLNMLGEGKDVSQDEIRESVVLTPDMSIASLNDAVIDAVERSALEKKRPLQLMLEKALKDHDQARIEADSAKGQGKDLQDKLRILRTQLQELKNELKSKLETAMNAQTPKNRLDAINHLFESQGKALVLAREIKTNRNELAVATVSAKDLENSITRANKRKKEAQSKLDRFESKHKKRIRKLKSNLEDAPLNQIEKILNEEIPEEQDRKRFLKLYRQKITESGSIKETHSKVVPNPIPVKNEKVMSVRRNKISSPHQNSAVDKVLKDKTSATPQNTRLLTEMASVIQRGPPPDIFEIQKKSSKRPAQAKTALEKAKEAEQNLINLTQILPDLPRKEKKKVGC